MVLNAVDLPAPFGPMTLTISPGQIVSDTVVKNVDPAVPGRDAVHRQERRRPRHGRRVHT